MPSTSEATNIPTRIHQIQDLEPSLANRIVSLLFEDTPTIGNNKILYPELAAPELVNAVTRHFDDEIATEPPDGVIVSPDSDVIDQVDASHIVETRREDFLSKTSALDPDFDYVLSITPRIQWSELEDRKRREYAQVSAQIKPDHESTNTELLFVERGLHFLNNQGHAGFLTTTDLKTDNTTYQFLSEVAQQTEFVEAIDPDDYDAVDTPHMMFRIQGDPPETRDDNWEYQPDPNEVESRLFAGTDTAQIDRSVRGIATNFDDLDLYTADANAGFVYFDMLYEDYDTALIAEALSEDIVLGEDVNMNAVRGYVAREELVLSESVEIREAENNLTNSVFIDPEQSIDTVLEILGCPGERFRYVGTPDDIEGLVTRFDLNKFPVYQYFYEAFAQFEIGLRRLIREEAPDWSDNAEEVQINTRAGPKLVSDGLAEAKLGQLIDIVDELELKRDIIVDIHGYDADLNQLNKLRSAVAHYNPIVHTMHDEGPEDKRSVPQLRREYELLSGCITGLN